MDDDTRATYSERETALILKRAAELEASVGRGDRRLSLAEIQEIAREAGIDPDVVADAARSVSLAEPSRTAAGLLGASPQVRFERDLPTLLAKEALPDVRTIISRETGKDGVTREILGGFEWQYRQMDDTVNVRVTPLGDRTRIEVVGHHRDAAAVTYGAATILAIVAGVVIGTSGGPLAPVDVLGLGAAAYLGGRLTWNGIARSIRRRLQRVFDAVSSRLTRDATESQRAPAVPDIGMPDEDA